MQMPGHRQNLGFSRQRKRAKTDEAAGMAQLRPPTARWTGTRIDWEAAPTTRRACSQARIVKETTPGKMGWVLRVQALQLAADPLRQPGKEYLPEYGEAENQNKDA